MQGKAQRAVTIGQLRGALRDREALLDLSARLAFGLLGQHADGDPIEQSLAALGQGTGVDRVYLFERRGRPGAGVMLFDQRYEWVAEGIEPQIDNPDLQGLDLLAVFPRVARRLLDGHAHGGPIESFEPAERAVLDPQGIQSLLVVPIILEQELWGFLGFDAVRAPRAWSTVEEAVLKVVAGALGAAVERRRADAELRRAMSVVESTRDAIAVAGLDGCIVSANPAMTRGSGFAREQLVGQPWRMMFADGPLAQANADEAEAALQTQGYWQGECLSRHSDGSTYPQWLSVNVVRDDAGQPSHYVIVGTDISPLKASEARFDHLAHHDMLTGLPNRRRIQQILARAIDSAGTRDERVAVLFLDLDRFKGVNDTLGHAAGDELLVEAVRRMRARLRGEDQLSRLGGDEFLVVLEHLFSVDEAVAVAEDLGARLRAPFALADDEVFATASIGISMFPTHASTAEALVQKADMAMYRAKQEGRDQVHVFSDELSEAARGALDLEVLLRRALENDGLRLHYQPRIQLLGGSISGAEALLRLPGANGVMVPAGQVIALAEKLGLIVPIGRWAIFEACRQVAQWQAAGLPPIPVAVNVSARQFYSDNLLQTVEAALASHGLPPSALEIELTESVLMDRPDEAGKVLAGLRELGISRALDDFGSGYSSLSYLMRFPVDRIKIDHQLVADLPHNLRASAIASTIAELARRLGLGIVAEGVENVAQVEFLRAEGFDEVQGFHYSRALPADAFAALLAASREASTT
jgi:diguanylate cyclase (GGDEF)-like protein/PAS domain S-box-containing protein